MTSFLLTKFMFASRFPVFIAMVREQSWRMMLITEYGMIEPDGGFVGHLLLQLKMQPCSSKHFNNEVFDVI